MRFIDVGVEFNSLLENRNKNQGNGKFHAEEFRDKYLKELEDPAFWQTPEENYITLDFTNVDKIGPSFANEAFGFFMKLTDESTFKKVVIFKNTQPIHDLVINIELNSARKIK